MTEVPNYDLPAFHSNIDQYLMKAQHDLEQAIVAYGLAGEEHSRKHAEYRRAKASAIKQLREEKNPVSIIADLAQGQVADMKEAEMASEYNAKRCRFMVDAIQSRINMMKFMGRANDRGGA